MAKRKVKPGQKLEMVADTYGGFQLMLAPEPKHSWPTGWGDERAYHIPARTEWSHPYSFDPMTLFDTGEKHTATVYHDRMQQWNYAKFQDCMQKAGDVAGELHFHWYDRSQVTKLLRLYNDDSKLEVTKVVKMVNMSSGYPIWFICYIPGPETPTEVVIL